MRDINYEEFGLFLGERVVSDTIELLDDETFLPNGKISDLELVEHSYKHIDNNSGQYSEKIEYKYFYRRKNNGA